MAAQSDVRLLESMIARLGTDRDTWHQIAVDAGSDADACCARYRSLLKERAHLPAATSAALEAYLARLGIGRDGRRHYYEPADSVSDAMKKKEKQVRPPPSAAGETAKPSSRLGRGAQ